MFSKPAVSGIKGHVSSIAERLKREHGITPKLVALVIGDDPASRRYVKLKTQDCAKVGITSEVIDLSGYSQKEMPQKVAATIRQLNDDPTVNAVLPQMPFGGKISPETVFSQLSPKKDVDGLTPFNLGKLFRGEFTLGDTLEMPSLHSYTPKSMLPCTPMGVILLAKYYKVGFAGKEAAVIGRSTLVGKPLAMLLQYQNATPTCYHTGSGSKLLKERIKQADIVVSAVGRNPKIHGEKEGFLLTGGMVKEDSAVFSVGQEEDPKTGKMLFDVDEQSLDGKCAFLTPNIGGIGPMTRACLLMNTVYATLNQLREKGVI